MQMKTPISIVAAGLFVSVFSGSTFAGGNNGTVCQQQGGADLICGVIQSFANYSAEQVNGVWYDAFALGSTQCNIGDVDLAYQGFPSNQHPASAPQLYKMKGGRLEQIGIGWLMHGFTALTENACGCGCNGHGGSVLGIGCSGPDTASYAGVQAANGPRWQINAYTGFFPTGSAANPPFSGTTARRVRVKSSDLEPSSPSVKYLVEWQYISSQDAANSKHYNNASYRDAAMTGGSNEFTLGTFVAATVREQPAIRAWHASDPAVVETDIQIPNEGLFILAAKATPVSGNVWNYEYALMNFNSDISGRAFRVPLPAGAVVTNVGFHDVDYHSGDSMNNFSDPNANFSGQDWTVTITNNSIEWATETYAQNINANALRWGTLYNFRFNINRAPLNGDVTLTTYKVDGEVNGATVVPGPAACAADISPIGNPDGTVNVIDLLGVINAWGACVPGNCGADINGDGVINVADMLGVVNAWGACP